MKAAVIVFPGSNCDRDVAVALRRSMGAEPLMVWHKQASFEAVDLMVLPGGFSYGDYLRCGAVAAHSPVIREVVARARRGVPLLGICNGFQILTETGLLPGAILRNANLKFICKDVMLRVDNTDTIFTQSYQSKQVIRIPIAHHDGNYHADDDTLARLEDEGRIVFRYCDVDGHITTDANPNGSLGNIAGIVGESGRVLGLMPHPERLADPLLGGSDGRPLFNGLARTLA